jgi:hypothetical protein
MISNEKLEQLARDFCDYEHFERRDEAELSYKTGFRAAEKMILDEASEGFEEWFGKNNYLYPNIPRDAWQAATINEHKKSRAMIKQLEWDLDAAENNQTEYILTILYRCEKFESAVRDMAEALKYYGEPNSWCHKGAHGGAAGSRYRIEPQDREHLPGWDDGLVVGGKTARAALEKHRALIEALKGEK